MIRGRGDTGKSLQTTSHNTPRHVAASPRLRVTVHVYDHIRADLGRSHLDVDLPSGSTVGELLDRLASEAHPLFGQLTDDDSSLYGVNLLVLNGDRLHFPRDLNRPLVDGSEIHLIPPITGGS